ncbi:hypothetical protein M011DRAFT_206688 [Sporormia fimetaria CBS 119925]|uniref:Uncharacterized protein n=1 Tax=Sporormia fimetaria CBS 119925 TaxID=1340428 RepID=A0A6A6V1U2_9PLEO|nr:hypothetical protein M011DRAFT_206688 [Sporormia fimetaria CBS 119925]
MRYSPAVSATVLISAYNLNQLDRHWVPFLSEMYINDEWYEEEPGEKRSEGALFCEHSTGWPLYDLVDFCRRNTHITVKLECSRLSDDPDFYETIYLGEVIRLALRGRRDDAELLRKLEIRLQFDAPHNMVLYKLLHQVHVGPDLKVFGAITNLGFRIPYVPDQVPFRSPTSIGFNRRRVRRYIGRTLRSTTARTNLERRLDNLDEVIWWLEEGINENEGPLRP